MKTFNYIVWQKERCTSSVLSYYQLCLQIFLSTCKIVATFRELCVKIKQNAKVGDWLAG